MHCEKLTPSRHSNSELAREEVLFFLSKNMVQTRKPLISVLIAVIALIGLAVFLSLPPDEPIVEDHPMSYWLGEVRSDNIEHSSPEFQHALRAMDDRCIPWLIDELNWHPSPGLRKTEELGMGWFHAHLNLISQDRRVQAALLLGSFGSRASNTIPALEKMSRYEQSNPDLYAIRGTAIAALILIRHDSVEACAKRSIDTNHGDYEYAMVCLGTNAESCIPFYIDVIKTTTNQTEKILAAWDLGLIHSRPESSLPALTSMLTETNVLYRRIAASAIPLFGSAGKPAWNDLVATLNDPDKDVRWHATNALFQIDPASAQKIGIGVIGPPLPP